PPDPRAVSLCDINLQHQVYLDNPQLCRWRRRGNAVRRYHTAKLENRKEMTVVIYEGQHAEEELKRDVAKHMKFRHPSFLQLYGTVHSQYVHASIFHEALIPCFDSLEKYHEHLSTITDVLICQQAANDYLERTFDTALRLIHKNNFTLFLRPSTGRLCIDLHAGSDYLFFPLPGTENIAPKCLFPTIDAQIIIDALIIEQYNEICAKGFRNCKWINFPPTSTVHLGAVYPTSGRHELGSPVAIAPSLSLGICTKSLEWHYLGTEHIAESGWHRFHISELIDRRFQDFYCEFDVDSDVHINTWLSQANHIFSCLGVFSNVDDHALMCWSEFTVEFQHKSPLPNSQLSNGYLFLCPPQSFQVGPASFKCPECFGYWSLDPLGVDRLRADQASELGFPAIYISISSGSRYWSDTVYAGLRQFHQGKGFDPDTQDLARHLRLPLYELCSDNEKSLNVHGKSTHICIPLVVLNRKYARQ
ncbi:hypothetical protein R3P38DRAFT_2523990, partial [Favolaschia claudopus]